MTTENSPVAVSDETTARAISSPLVGTETYSGVGRLADMDMDTKAVANTAHALEWTLAPEDKVFFLHLPKTAGTTLGNALESHFPRRQIFPHYSLDALQSVVPGMCDGFTYFRGHYKYDVIQRLIGCDPVCLTMLRDPIERFISHFAHWQRLSPGGADVGFDTFPYDTLADYLAHEDIVVATRNMDAQTDTIGGEAHFEHPDELVADFAAVQRRFGAIVCEDIQHGARELDRARRRLDGFAFVGLAERFQESLFLLCYTFGWQPILDGERLNVTPHRPQRAHLDEEVLRQIISFNTLDLALYAHATRLFAARYARMIEELLHRYAPQHAHQPAQTLSHAAIHGLLEQHYERHFAASHQLVGSLRIDFDDPFPAQGWYPPEFLPDYGTVRWTGPETIATLDLPLTTDRDLGIRFRIIWSLAPDVLASLSFTVNSQPVALTAQYDDTGATIYTGRIPRKTLVTDTPFTRLAFGVGRTPAVGDGDLRRLGLLFNWIEISPQEYSSLPPLSVREVGNPDQ